MNLSLRFKTLQICENLKKILNKMSKAKCELKKRKLDHIHSEKLDLDQKKDAQHPYYYVVPGSVAGSLYLSTYLVFITTL